MPAGFYEAAKESLANAYGLLSEFNNAERVLTELFAETGSERILKKLYFSCLLSKDTFPEDRFRKYEDRFPDWSREYDEECALLKETAASDDVLALFQLPEPEARKELKKFSDNKKEEYRSMLE